MYFSLYVVSVGGIAGIIILWQIMNEMYWNAFCKQVVQLYAKRSPFFISLQSWQWMQRVWNIICCQRGYNHVFLPHIPPVFVSEGSQLLTGNRIALQRLCVWSRGDKAEDEWGICSVSLGAEQSWRTSFISERGVWRWQERTAWHSRPPSLPAKRQSGSWQMLILH